MRADDLHPGPERRRPLALVASSPQDLRLAQPRIDGDFLRDARLPDARLAGEMDELAPPRERLLERAPQHVLLALAADEDTALQAVERVRIVARRSLGDDERRRRDRRQPLEYRGRAHR